MTIIKAYNEGNQYEKFQSLRPDYVGAINTFIEFSQKYSFGKENIVVSDFCCGTGSNTKKYAEIIGGIKKARLIDINKGFLEIAKNSGINTEELEVINKNVLEINSSKESDFLFSHITIFQMIKRKSISKKLKNL